MPSQKTKKTQTKKSNKTASRKISNARRIKLPLFLIVFALIGLAMLVYTYAATPRNKGNTRSKKNSGTLSIRYVEEKPVVVTQSDDSLTYTDRPREIEVSDKNVLYCTPRDSGDITTRKLSRQEVERLKADVNAAIDSSGATDIKADESAAEVNSYSGLTIELGGRRKDTRVFSSDLKSGKFNEVVDALERLCSAATEKIDDLEVPVWDGEVTPSTEPTSSLPSKIADALLPKASAAGSAQESSFEASELVRLTNVARQQAGLPVLKREHCLNASSREWNFILTASDSFYHADIGVIIPKHCGNGWARLGENLARVQSTKPSNDAVATKAAHDALMRSPGHRANILHPDFNKIGIAAHRDSKGRIVYTQHFWKDRGGAGSAPIK